jgi:hypothetical protein
MPKKKKPARSPYEATDVFDAAEYSYRAAIILNLNRLPVMKSQAPVASMFAFTLELYLKSLVALESGVAAIGYIHEVDDLFNGLSQATKDAIRDSFRAIITREDYSQKKFAMMKQGRLHEFVEEPDEVLRQCRDSFVMSRYIYQYPNTAQFNGSAMIEAVRTFILKHHPVCIGRKPSSYVEELL